LQKVDILTLIIVVILMIIGAIFSYSLPVFLEMRTNLSHYHFVKNYIIFAIFGLVIMILLAKVNPDKWFDIIGWGIFLLSGTLLIIMPFLPKFLAPTINGAHRWINLGLLKLAPVEFFKIGVIFFLAWSFNRKLGNMNLKEELIQVFYYFILLGIFWAFIVIYQSDLGQVIIMLAIFILMLIVAGGKLQSIGFLSLITVISFTIAILTAPYRLNRIKLWLIRMHEIFFKDKSTVNLASISHSQIQQSINAIYHGGIFGKGIGNGIFKLGYLSDVHTDFVLAGIAEESGIIGISLVIVLIALLIYRIFKIAYRLENKKYQLFTFGVGSLIAFQFLFNGLGITGMLPLKGLTVPFLSYGGSSLISLSIGIGIVLMLSKKADL